MVIPYTTDQLKEAILQLVQQNDLTEGYIRPIVYLGGENMSIKTANIPPQVVISVRHWGKYLSAQCIHVKIPSIRKTHPSSTDLKAKISAHYATSIMAGHQIHEA